MSEKVLTESGTNEVEIVEFSMGDGIFGVNVAKVIKIMNYQAPTKVFKSAEAMEGLINYRDKVIPVISLCKYLGIPQSVEPENRMYIITHFNNKTLAFEVEKVIGIRRVLWADIETLESDFHGLQGESTIVGVIKSEDKLTSLIDFESILMNLSGSNSPYKTEDLEDLVQENKEIVFAEDSDMLSKVLKENLKKIGFSNIVSFPNGQSMLSYLQGKKDSLEGIYCVISDIEMPVMDGLTATRKIKEDPVLKDLKVVLFSSLITDELRNKGDAVGADAQISKPDMKELTKVLRKVNG